MALKSFAHNHHKIIENGVVAAVKDSRAFRSFSEFTLAAGATRKVYINIPAGVYVGLLRSSISAWGSPCKLSTYKNPTLNALGDPMATFPHNLVHPSLSLLELSDDADVTNLPADKINAEFAFAASSQGNTVGVGDESGSSTRTLATESTYSLEIENIGGDPAVVVLKYTWIEDYDEPSMQVFVT